MLRIGLFLETRHLGRWRWDGFRSGALALSGTDAQFLAVAEGLRRRGHDVLFLTTHRADDSGILEEHTVASLSDAIVVGKQHELDIVVFNNRADRETERGLHTCVNVQQPCVVWDQNGPSPKMADLLCAPVVRRLVCVSIAQADQIRDHPVFGRTEVIYNSLDPAWCTDVPGDVSRRNPYSVCFLGCLTQAKGFHHLARVWPAVRKVHPEATLTVIGSSRLYDRLAAVGPLGVADPNYERMGIIPYLGATVEEALGNNVRFLGLVGQNQIHDVLAMASIGVVNPHCSGPAETFCVSALEIQAAGAVVVGADRGGLRETVRDGETGVLIRHERHLARVLTTLLGDKERCRGMGRSGQIWVREAFRRDLIIDRWCSLLESVCSNTAPRPIRFSLGRANLPTALREVIRQARRIPILGRDIPTLHSIKQRISAFKQV